MKEMQTFICSISKQHGVRIKKKTISEKFVFMLTIGKIFVANLIYILTRHTSAERGTLKIKL